MNDDSERHEEFELSTADGHRIRAQAWHPAGSPTACIQILHGLGEYSDRYARFAAAANERGFSVYIHDHRGHGPQRQQAGFFAERDGWATVVDDARLVTGHIRAEHAGVPFVLLGHSMGSFVAQCYAMQYGTDLNALLLSGSAWPSRLQTLPAMLVARLEQFRHGPRGYSPLLDKLGFSSFNKRFEPGRTDHDWLSRDAEEVDRYIADPLCGGPYTCRLWLDLLGALWTLGSDAGLRHIPGTLPILITGGEMDPVGGDRSLTQLAMHYAQTGHQRIKVLIYPDGRHEMLNETNRDEVTRDWLDWIEATTRNARSG